ncbi:MAG: response regulator transcription factor [Armatimonadota bacterium]|nr:response regulator transcription factor [Armatimonadota bacterium]MDR7512206.1 response regulator transcription factor [Armatimonadota bacterium]
MEGTGRRGPSPGRADVRPAPLRVVLAEDHAIVREGIRRLLAAEPDIVVVGEAADGHAAVDLTETLRPDVVCMDISMPGLSGLEATRQIKARLPEVGIVVLTMHEDEAYFYELVKAGASGYVLKRASARDLVDAVRAVAGGHTFLHPLIAQRLVSEHERTGGRDDDRRRYDGLTERERQVVRLIANGKTNREIAEALHISVKTVETHRTHIMEKLDLHDRAHLVRYAVRKGLIDL